MLLQNIICKIDRFTFAKRQFTVAKFEWQAVNSQNNIKLECTVQYTKGIGSLITSEAIRENLTFRAKPRR